MYNDTFEDYLKEEHMNEFPMLLDDDIPDHYGDWVGTLDVDEVIKYADQWGAKIRKSLTKENQNG